MSLGSTSSPADVLRLIKDAGIKIVDLRFMDFPGMWQHTSYPVSEIDESTFSDGMGFEFTRPER